MSTNRTTLRRRATAMAVAGALLLLPGCAALSELTGDGGTTTSPSPEAASAEPSAAPSSEAPSPRTEPSASASPSVTAEPSASASPSPSASPSASPSTTPPTDDGAAEAEDGEGDDTKDKDKTKETAEPEPEYLEVGSSGTEVTALQERLQDLGYYLPSVDGSFGPMTQQAVWALQKAAGLYRDGVVGPKTEQALADGVRPGAESSSGKVVEIDLDRQLIKAVEDGEVVRTINASSGNGESYEALGRTYTATTPRGTYAVYMERDYLHESTLELGSMYRPKYFTGGIAVHGSGSIPPYPASHGCIRVSNSAMDWLWDTWGVPKGTTVVVY
jgi:lipoprotein-anchoring transpeptidase ErfK/SrfK